MLRQSNKLTSILVALGVLLLSSCKTLLPSAQEGTTIPWSSYNQMEQVINKIIPNKTTREDLRKLGIDFKSTPNLKTLTYLDVMERFKLDSTLFNSIKLPPGIEDALNQHEKCKAYELVISQTSKKRIGSFWKDMLSFKQVTHSTGWSFSALIILVDDTVVYVLHSGSPVLDKIETNKQPLGPFQGIDAGAIMNAAGDL